MPPRDGKSDLSTEIRLDHREREIHAGGHPCGRPNATFLNVDSIAIDQNRGPKSLQSFNLIPMSRSPSAV
jgi:hypothetical protein